MGAGWHLYLDASKQAQSKKQDVGRSLDLVFLDGGKKGDIKVQALFFKVFNFQSGNFIQHMCVELVFQARQPGFMGASPGTPC